MGLVRILIIIAVIWLLFVLVRRLLRSLKNDPKPSPGGAEFPRMLACTQCGVHVPEDRALKGAHGVYCGPEHFQIGEQSGR